MANIRNRSASHIQGMFIFSKNRLFVSGWALYRWWVPFRKSTKIKSGKRAQVSIFWFQLKAGMYLFFMSLEKLNIFFKRINLFYLQSTRAFCNFLPNYRCIESFQNYVRGTSTTCLLRHWVFILKIKSSLLRAKFQ